ncbi:MAG: transposase [Burkholderia gladioli]
MFFDELNDEEWTRVSTLIADEPIRLNRRGRPRAETRVVANAILWILTTGEPWSKLPGRYPSGPTCRRRFEEWLASGTLGEMVAMLTDMSRRTFAYVPPPPELVVPAPSAEPAVNNDRLRGVFWQNPESWRLPVADADDAWRDEEDEAGMRQTVREAPVAASIEPLPPLQPAEPQLARLLPSVQAAAVALHVEPAVRTGDPAESEANANANAEGEHARPVSVRFATVAPQSEPYRGYTLYGTAQPVQNMMYRAWAEIAQDGRRVERSGLIGPRFSDPEAAERFAIAWARDWVDQHCALEADAELPAATVAAPAAAAPLAHHEPVSPPKLRTVHPVSAALATLSTLVPNDRRNIRHVGTERLGPTEDELGEAAARAKDLSHREIAYQIG